MRTFTVSFFGHRQIEAPFQVESQLEKLISQLLQQNEFVEFLVGREGEFDQLVSSTINKYAKAASVIDPSIPEKIPPHLMRHTKAMHIYDADNDLVHVRDFLGHSDIKTTDIYARSSLTMKQKALERVSDSPVPSMPSWQKSRSTMEWLKSFGSQKA